jgi:hypothetical protein
MMEEVMEELGMIEWELQNDAGESKIAEDVTDVEDQSFRQSFYTSGSDWSGLYEVDDYGMPLSCSPFQENDECQRSKPRNCENMDPQCSPSSSNTHRNMTLVKASGNKAAGKFVQSDLCNFLGIKPKVVLETNSNGKRLRQQDVGLLLGISPSLKAPSPNAAEFLTKFKRVSNLSDKIEPLKKKRGRGNFGISPTGEAEASRKCPFYKRIPGITTII